MAAMGNGKRGPRCVRRWSAALGIGALLLLLVFVAACSADAPAAGLGEGAGAEAQGSQAGGPSQPAPAVPAGLRAAYIAAVQAQASAAYDFEPGDDGVSARGQCEAQGLSVEFAAGELRAAPSTEDWELQLSWTGLGRGAQLEPVAELEGAVEVSANRVSHRRSDGSEEWYLNGALGIEQGFVLAHRPEAARPEDAAEPLGLELAVAGDLVPALVEPADERQGATVALFTRDGQAALRYSDLFVTDAAGEPLEAWLEVREARIVLRIDDEQASYPIAIDPLIWLEQQKLTASDGAASDFFGTSVALSGDTALIGAYCDDDSGGSSGSAYVFVRAGGSWTEQDKLTASDGAEDDYFGWSVALSGGTALVGAPCDDDNGASSGSAYVFLWGGTDGTPCTEDSGCHSGYCADEVCCNEPCGGGQLDDCQACSVARGAAMDGVCGPVGDGASCTDGDACTLSDTCQAGACTAGTAVACPPSDQCHDAGTCNSATGVCSAPAKPDGSPCSDDDPCTQGDSCQGGRCIAGSPGACTAESDDDGGCGCRLQRAQSATSPWAALCLLGLGGVLIRRRRRKLGRAA